MGTPRCLSAAGRCGWVTSTGAAGLRLDAAARLIQDIGQDHVHALGFDKTHPVGVVRRTMVDLIRPIEFEDMLRLRRWCSGTSTRWCEIRVRIDGGQGGLIESEAFWININRDTGMPSRLSDDFLDELQHMRLGRGGCGGVVSHAASLCHNGIRV